MSNDGHIFISYSRTDGNIHADKLESALQERGFAIWRDLSGVNPGGDFTADLEEAIELSRSVLVCITPDTKRRDSFVRREIQYALDCKKPVIALRFAHIRPHIAIYNNEWIDFFRDWDKAFARLLAALGTARSDIAGHPPPMDPFRPYLETLYEQIDRFLERTVIEPIDLMADETSDAVSTERDAPVPGMLEQLFMTHDIVGAGGGESGVFVDFEEAFQRYEGSLLLLGEPGAGKTTTMMHYLRQAAIARLRDATAPLPLLGVISTWDSENQPSIHRWLAGGYRDLKADMIRHEIEQGRALLLLDGLDELGHQREMDVKVPPDSGRELPEYVRARYDPRVRFMQMIPADNRVVVSCRVRDYSEMGERIALRGAITLRPLDDTQLDAYLQDQPELKAALDRDDELREMARRPLVLRLFTIAFAGLGEATGRLHELDGGDLRDAIFETYVQRRFAHEQRKPHIHIEFTLDQIENVLGRMAMENAAGLLLGQPTWAENVISYSEFERLMSEINIQPFIEQCIQLNLLTPNDRNTVRFVHRMLRDYFAFNYALPRLDDPALYASGRTPAAALAALADSRAGPTLRQALYADDARIRAGAAQALGHIGDELSLPALTRAVDDPDLNVARTVVTAIGRLGTAAIPALLDIRRSPRGELLPIAADALLNLADHAAVPALLGALDDPSSNIRWVAARALGRTGDLDAVPGLLHAMRDDDTRVRTEATDALASLGSAAIPALLHTLEDGDAGIRQLTAQALSKTAWIPDTEDQAARYYVALGQWNNAVKFGDFAVPHLLDALDDDETRGGAAGALGRIGGTALPGLLNALNSPNREIRRTAAGVLGRLKRSQAVPALVAALHDEAAYVRVGAVRALGQINDPAAIPALVAALNDLSAPDSKGKRVCDAAAQALQKIDTPEALAAVRAWQSQQ